MTDLFARKGGLVLISTILLAALSGVYTYFIVLKHSTDSQTAVATVLSQPSAFSKVLKPVVFDPKYLTIEKIGLKDVAMVNVGVEPDGRLEVPKSFDEAGWYKDGAKPGENGNAIIAGHYDRVGGSPAVFYNLVKLAASDLIEVKDATDKKYTYRIKTVEYVNVNDPEAINRAYEHSNDPIMTVITCGGVWNIQTHDYSKRLLIKATKV